MPDTLIQRCTIYAALYLSGHVQIATHPAEVRMRGDGTPLLLLTDTLDSVAWPLQPGDHYQLTRTAALQALVLQYDDELDALLNDLTRLTARIRSARRALVAESLTGDDQHVTNAIAQHPTEPVHAKR